MQITMSWSTGLSEKGDLEMVDIVSYVGAGMVLALYSITALMVVLEAGTTYKELFIALYR